MRVGVEGTGSYGVGLARALRAADIAVVEVHRPNRLVRRRVLRCHCDAEKLAFIASAMVDDDYAPIASLGAVLSLSGGSAPACASAGSVSFRPILEVPSSSR